MSDTNVSAWLRRETPEHLRLLERLRERLVRKLDRADKLEAGPKGDARDPVPDRDWCRAMQRYQAGYTGLLVEERERAKLALMAKVRGAGQPLSDEEYETGIREIQDAAIRGLPPEDLAAEAQRRGYKLLPAGLDEDEREDA